MNSRAQTASWRAPSLRAGEAAYIETSAVNDSRSPSFLDGKPGGCNGSNSDILQQTAAPIALDSAVFKVPKHQTGGIATRIAFLEQRSAEYIEHIALTCLSDGRRENIP